MHPSLPSYFALSSTSLARYKQGNQQTKGQTHLQHSKCIYLNNTILKCINNCRATMFNVIVAEVKTKENHWTQFCIIQLVFARQISKLICLGLIWHEKCTCLLLLIMLWCITLDRKHSILFPILFSKNSLYIIQLDLEPYSVTSTWRFPESTSQRHKKTYKPMTSLWQVFATKVVGNMMLTHSNWQLCWNDFIQIEWKLLNSYLYFV